uniref:Uncharacterized protein n=1 Tax=Arundo donax TaxID=35708 RepID=A0A0A9TPT2_ARUDO
MLCKQIKYDKIMHACAHVSLFSNIVDRMKAKIIHYSFPTLIHIPTAAVMD